jgi:dihydroorotase
MSHLDIPLLFHGEVTDQHVDIFDREQVFIETILYPLTERYPDLRIVLEHITTKNAVDFVKDQSKNVAATITIHHLLYNRNDIFLGGLRPHLYCLPILKRDIHQKALIKAALSGNPKFFLGTDSAPHTQSKKESGCGCAGVYSAPAALELYFEFFENNHELDKLEGFASFFGADFYQLARSKKTITLEKNKWRMPKEFIFEDESIIPIHADQELQWKITED